jgi:hypothetical protein
MAGTSTFGIESWVPTFKNCLPLLKKMSCFRSVKNTAEGDYATNFKPLKMTNVIFNKEGSH